MPFLTTQDHAHRPETLRRWISTRGPILVLILVWLAIAAPARAHPLAPAVLDLQELRGGRVDVSWRLPLPAARGATARPVLPEWCTNTSSPTSAVEATSIRRRWTVDCGDRGLAGGVIRVEDLETSGADAFVRVTRLDGSVLQSIVSPNDPSLSVPEQADRAGVLWTYGVLGAEHMLGGLDHLLIVFGLLLLARRPRRVLATIAAFGVGHSLTLSLAILGGAHFPAGPAELAIASSVFVLAVYVDRRGAHGERPGPEIAPWVLAFAFGLLHGLGFAIALRESNLPGDALPLSLFGFNTGIEVGQIAFVFCVLALWRIASRLSFRLPAWSYRAPIYTMGSLAAFWCFERGAALLR